MVIVADTNTIWRSRPFEALAELRPVLGLKPSDPIVSYKSRGNFFGASKGMNNAMFTLAITLPFRWATTSAPRSLPKLWRSVLKHLRKTGEKPTALIVTSPHYAPLLAQIGDDCPTFYYCSDNYADYAGWDSEEMRRQEDEIVLRADHSFFVSGRLRERAQREYAVSPEKLSVSMNGTGPEFLSPVGNGEVERLFLDHPKLKRPIAGVIGGVNAGIDYGLLRKVAALEQLGTLLFVGRVENAGEPELAVILKHPRVLSVGPQPHCTLPTWMQILDVALIPYRRTEFNSFRSPMRLFDHLASGRPIVATDGCPQVLEFAEEIAVAASDDDFLGELIEATAAPISPDLSNRMRDQAKLNTWSNRARILDETISLACAARKQSPV